MGSSGSVKKIKKQIISHVLPASFGERYRLGVRKYSEDNTYFQLQDLEGFHLKEEMIESVTF